MAHGGGNILHDIVAELGLGENLQVGGDLQKGLLHRGVLCSSSACSSLSRPVVAFSWGFPLLDRSDDFFLHRGEPAEFILGLLESGLHRGGAGRGALGAPGVERGLELLEAGEDLRLDRLRLVSRLVVELLGGAQHVGGNGQRPELPGDVFQQLREIGVAAF